MPSALSTSIVICTYTDERWDCLRQAVSSARAQRHRPDEVIVVADHNAALLDRMRAELAGVRTIPNEGPAGLSGARNSGVAAAGGDIVVFLDDDAVARRRWLETLLDAYDNPTVVGVGGHAEPLWPAGRPGWWPPEFDWVVGCSYRGLPATRAPVRNLMGCNMSFRREVLDRVGDFVDGIGRVGDRPLGCEETELCIRIARQMPGARFIYEPGARVFHRVAESRVTWSYFRRRCLAEGRSKAMVSRRTGSADALRTERDHVRRALVHGVRRDVAALVRHRDLDGARRALCSAGGLAAAGAGFVAGHVGRNR
ncbi:MAG: glycosyltransferase family 2 protein [Acidimicrobiales bacterium]